MESVCRLSSYRRLQVSHRSVEVELILIIFISVWTIAALDNGDIAVGSDRRIWIFTQDADRFAEESLEKVGFVSSSKALPLMSRFQEFAALVATRPKPVPVAEVEAAPGARTMFEDVEYDFVFSIDIADDRPAIKLPYNVGGKSAVARSFAETDR